MQIATIACADTDHDMLVKMRRCNTFTASHAFYIGSASAQAIETCYSEPASRAQDLAAADVDIASVRQAGAWSTPRMIAR